jgi:hypothetical protein
MRAQSDGPHWRTKLKTMRDPGVGKCLSRRSGREYPGFLPGTTQALELENREVGELVMQRLIYHHLQTCVKLILIGLRFWITVALVGPHD